MGSISEKSFTRFTLILALLLILGGGFLAHEVQTSGGIQVRDVRFMGSGGKLMSALLYIPPGASNKTPAPGILAIHGYINSRETQDGFAIEFARRGYVVLALDQTGHGYSDPPAFANGFGGPDALKYLRSLDFVDAGNVALEGHSMGGWASLIAAATNPEGYRSIVVASSSTGTFGAPEGTAVYPRNMGLIFSTYDEFSALMWASPIPAGIVNSPKAKKLFGTQETIVPGRLYGSIEDGTARKLYQPRMIHPWVHFSSEAIGYAVDWMQATLKGGNGLPSSDQIWIWKEIGTLIALIGMVLLLLPLGTYLLQAPFFKDLNELPAPAKSVGGYGWWIGAVLMTVIPVAVYMRVWQYQGKGIAKVSYIWGQQVTSVIMLWAVAVAAISIVLFGLWHWLINRRSGAVIADYGLAWKQGGSSWVKIAKSFLMAALIVGAAYLSLAFSDWAFKTDYRFWVFAIKPMSRLHFGIFLGYLIPFTIYFLATGVALHGQMRKSRSNGQPLALWQETLINIALLLVGLIGFLLYQYVPLFMGRAMPRPDLNLAAIVLFQFVVMFIMVGVVMTFFHRKTGHVYVGAFVSAMIVTWAIVAGQATHYPY